MSRLVSQLRFSGLKNPRNTIEPSVSSKTDSNVVDRATWRAGAKAPTRAKQMKVFVTITGGL